MRQPKIIKILKKITPAIGAKLIIEPEFGHVGQIIFKNGKKTLFRNHVFNINGLGAAKVAKDKGYSKFFLKKFGYQVCEGQVFYSKEFCQVIKSKRDIAAGLAYAKKIGFPVIIKPNDLSQGNLVAKVHNAKDYSVMANKIFKETDVMMVEKYYPGNDYRVVVLDGRVISAYQRIPLSLIGDGKKTIFELISQKQKHYRSLGRANHFLDDFRIKMNLKQKGFTKDSILKNKEKIYLLDNANLSTGGEAIDVTEKIHPDFKKLAINITKDMDLRLCGVDLINAEITKPLKDYAIIEVNAAPGLDNYASIGKTQNEIVEKLYLKILKALEKN
ncbi:MAG: cyanophycin synthetase [Parcubacteria group bacterium GW2011_GWE2_39_37]|uniref:Cyanophycin synthetase n=1 Tax=Candidatus Falkowbacteria bacterium GW2011_GWF2_39_8 TaxID=1618642 RepID=A0A0G0PZL4_9BACT|nr:MAG: cyanophycin synthetase [Parcubacteria group bacterium GW2011_GWE2_39_37]KKR33343.1 MAG: cyanophycin synthetase [Candidatus Falkowbacteria bacterium GW2011_GWF2_39_8]